MRSTQPFGGAAASGWQAEMPRAGSLLVGRKWKWKYCWSALSCRGLRGQRSTLYGLAAWALAAHAKNRKQTAMTSVFTHAHFFTPATLASARPIPPNPASEGQSTPNCCCSSFCACFRVGQSPAVSEGARIGQPQTAMQSEASRLSQIQSQLPTMRSLMRLQTVRPQCTVTNPACHEPLRALPDRHVLHSLTRSAGHTLFPTTHHTFSHPTIARRAKHPSLSDSDTP